MYLNFSFSVWWKKLVWNNLRASKRVIFLVNYPSSVSSLDYIFLFHIPMQRWRESRPCFNGLSSERYLCWPLEFCCPPLGFRWTSRLLATNLQTRVSKSNQTECSHSLYTYSSSICVLYQSLGGYLVPFCVCIYELKAYQYSSPLFQWRVLNLLRLVDLRSAQQWSRCEAVGYFPLTTNSSVHRSCYPLITGPGKSSDSNAACDLHLYLTSISFVDRFFIM